MRFGLKAVRGGLALALAAAIPSIVWSAEEQETTEGLDDFEWQEYCQRLPGDGKGIFAQCSDDGDLDPGWGYGEYDPGGGVGHGDGVGHNELDCNNGIDDDDDGLVDCRDPECVQSASCKESCFDHVDNDGDGLIDCDDLACSQLPLCHPEICDNGIDDDKDGFTDCASIGCLAAPSCAERCDDGRDNNDDGRTDCQDPRCEGDPSCTEICDDGADQDGDRLIDCEDPDCDYHYPCGPEDCYTFGDEDDDGLFDCDDPDCAPFLPGACRENCTFGVDSDHDGYGGCLDPDCVGFEACQPQPFRDPTIRFRVSCVDRSRVFYYDWEAYSLTSSLKLATVWLDGELVEEVDCSSDDCLYREGQVSLLPESIAPVEVVLIVADAAGGSRAAKVMTDRCR